MEDIFNSQDRDRPSAAEGMAVLELRELFRDVDRDVDRIVAFIRQYPNLTAETLRRSNNAVFGNVERTTDIYQAVNRLGYYEIYNIVAAASNQRLLPLDVENASASVRR